MKKTRPTEAELEILSVLWEHGPLTVRDVLTHLDKDRPKGYTTVLKLLQIMKEKGLVDRIEDEKAHVYRAALQIEDARTNMLKLLTDRLFTGSAKSLVLHAVGQESSPEKLEALKKLLDSWEESK